MPTSTFRLDPPTDDEVRAQIRAAHVRHERELGIPSEAWRCAKCGKHPTECLNRHPPLQEATMHPAG